MAIEKDGIKYACINCIRGHRVKKCQHFDRELIPVQKRGRQVSQCNHCRVLRTTSGSHVKCTCAIATVPNPINGCLCEVIQICNCVARHLRNINPNDNINNNNDENELFMSPVSTLSSPSLTNMNSNDCHSNSLSPSTPLSSISTIPMITSTTNIDLNTLLSNDITTTITNNNKYNNNSNNNESNASTLIDFPILNDPLLNSHPDHLNIFLPLSSSNSSSSSSNQTLTTDIIPEHYQQKQKQQQYNVNNTFELSNTTNSNNNIINNNTNINNNSDDIHHDPFTNFLNHDIHDLLSL